MSVIPEAVYDWQDVLEQTSQATLKTVSDFAASQHRSRAKRCGPAHPLRRLVPTAVTIAGGINAADHADTFAELIRVLRAEVGIHTACSAVIFRSESTPDLTQHSQPGWIQACTQLLRFCCACVQQQPAQFAPLYCHVHNFCLCSWCCKSAAQETCLMRQVTLSAQHACMTSRQAEGAATAI